MKVKAIRQGYYDHIRRREGDVFKLVEKKGFKTGKDGKLAQHTFTVEEQFSANWMEKVTDKTPEKVTSGPQALKAQQQDLRALKHGGPVADADVI